MIEKIQDYFINKLDEQTLIIIWVIYKLLIIFIPTYIIIRLILFSVDYLLGLILPM